MKVEDEAAVVEQLEIKDQTSKGAIFNRGGDARILEGIKFEFFIVTAETGDSLKVEIETRRR